MIKVFKYNNDNLKEYVLKKNLIIDGVELKYINNRCYYVKEDGTYGLLELGEKQKIQNIEIICFSNQPLEYKYNDAITFSNFGDVKINEGSVLIKNNKIIKENVDVYVNRIKQNTNEFEFCYGDQILINDLLIYLTHETISIYGNVNTNLTQLYNVKNITKDFPKYWRSPRLVKELTDEQIEIKKPKVQEKFSKQSLFIIIGTPLITTAISIIMSVVMGRGWVMMLGVIATLFNLFISVGKYFNDKKEIEKENQARLDNWDQYMIKTQTKINEQYKSIIDAINYNYPTIKQIDDMINQYSPRIYERDIYSKDFSEIEIGTMKKVTPFPIKFEDDMLDIKQDPLIDQAKELYQRYRYVNNYPVLINPLKANIGLLGTNRILNEQLKILISQLTFSHSYHDLAISMLYDEKDHKDFSYLNIYPHFKLPEYNIYASNYKKNAKELILNSFYNLLKERNQQFEDSNGNVSFSQHLMLIVKDLDDIINHSIIKLLRDNNKLNASVIICSHDYGNLPDFVKTIVKYNDSDHGILLINEEKEVSQEFKTQRIGDIDFEHQARELSVLDHQIDKSVNIPEKVGFLELFNARTIDDLNIKKRWEEARIDKSIAVPIGIKSEGELINLNLHEKAHGPHGLVAGTTGSGKSETIQTYILSLALNFSPEDVGFLLIDFKGGGMAGLFQKLPHVLGTITNRDGDDIYRNLDSVQAEVDRRQDLFTKCGVNNINLYTQLYKKGEVSEPLPHLFIISDEFAELKREHPDFMAKLVSIARIGRTLGIHLILATQKPTGVVDDQIWSNSKFKLALKVQDESDSKEILKTPDASYITLPGRGYLQVGNNEIYELFQSGYSGAPYNPDGDEDTSDIDYDIYSIDEVGQMEIVNTKEEKQEQDFPTELEAIIDEIHDIYQETKKHEIQKTWLPTLEEMIIAPLSYNNQDLSQINELDLTCELGKVDLPQMQKYAQYCVDFKNDGNLMVYASSGYGKSTTLSTIINTLCLKNNPELLNFYIIDLGTNALMPFKQMPHVIDYLTFDSSEKLSKLHKILNKEIQNRRLEFAKNDVTNLEQYNKISANKLPQIFLVIDNYDSIAEMSNDFEDFMKKLSRDGNGVGINLIISLTRGNAIKAQVSSNFKTKLLQYIFDDNERASLFGRDKNVLKEDKLGRCLVDFYGKNVMQTYFPLKVEKDEVLFDCLKQEIDSINQNYTGKQLLPIPTLPDVFTTSNFKDYNKAYNHEISLGLNLDDVELEGIDRSNTPFLILGQPKFGKTNLLEVIMSQVDNYYLFDSESGELYSYKKKENVKYFGGDDSYKEFYDFLVENNKIHEAKIKELLDNNQIERRDDYIKDLKPIYVFIDELEYFIQNTTKAAILSPEKILKSAADLNVKIIVTANSAKFNGVDNITKMFKSLTNGITLGSYGYTNVFNIPSSYKPRLGYGVVSINSMLKEIKLPVNKEENNE